MHALEHVHTCIASISTSQHDDPLSSLCRHGQKQKEQLPQAVTTCTVSMVSNQDMENRSSGGAGVAGSYGPESTRQEAIIQTSSPPCSEKERDLMIDSNGIGSGPSDYGATPTSPEAKAPVNRSSGGAGVTGSYGPASNAINSSSNSSSPSGGVPGPATRDDPMQQPDKPQSKM